MRLIYAVGLFISIYLLHATPAFSLVDGQVLLGKRSATISKKSGSDGSIAGGETKLALHVDPIPLVPIAFGASFSSINFSDDDKTNFRFDEFKGTEMNLEVMAWVPLDLFGLQPYGKLGYTFAGNMKSAITVAGIKTEAEYAVSGTEFALGLNWSPIPFVGFLLEYGMGQKKYEAKEITTGPLKVSAGSDADLEASSSSILVGVEVGI